MAKRIIFGEIIGKGKRGIVRKGKYNGKGCAIKIVNPKSTAINRLENEANWLKKLNKKKIGPKFYYFDGSKLVMEYLDGVHLESYMEDKNIVLVLKKILKQCRIMDKLKVNKFEMHNITKNCIVVGKKPVLIDFERCKVSLEPKNVTQFCQFLLRKGFCKDKKMLLVALRKYKKNMSESNFTFLEKLFF